MRFIVSSLTDQQVCQHNPMCCWYPWVPILQASILNNDIPSSLVIEKCRTIRLDGANVCFSIRVNHFVEGESKSHEPRRDHMFQGFSC
jgi:hypothetical protein